ncbi:hypothetical protein LINPERPRIM_LOCUS25595, partial [Linum perenne]
HQPTQEPTDSLPLIIEQLAIAIPNSFSFLSQSFTPPHGHTRHHTPQSPHAAIPPVQSSPVAVRNSDARPN